MNSSKADHTTTLNRPTVGLFDMPSLEDVVDALCECFDYSRPEVYERLFKEALQTGYNVQKAARQFGLTPHIYDAKMEKFYKQTDAFIFESLVVHQANACQEIDARVSDYVNQYCTKMNRAPDEIQILILGDGIGTDTLRFIHDGFPFVTYFEFDGRSSDFAKHRFARQNASPEVVHESDNIRLETYDVVICREVLEHVPDPPEMIRDISSYVKSSGIAIVTESYGVVEPNLPTHLKQNKRFEGRNIRLFEKADLHLVGGSLGERPLVFQKGLATIQIGLKPSRIEWAIRYKRVFQTLKRLIKQ